MANELLVGVKIGAVLSGTFQSAFASARGTSLKLGQAADELRVKHARLGDVMARAMSHPTRNVGELRRQYERLGQTIDQLRAKQEKLAASMARGEALKAARADLRGQAMETAGTALALGAPVVKSVQLAASYQDAIKDIAITGELSRNEELKLGQTIRDAALRYNQTQFEIAKGVGVLIAEGMDPAKAERQAGMLAKTATATRATFEDLARMNVSFDLLGVKNMELAFNQAAKGGKQGSFELRDMAKWFPALGGAMKSLGVVGNEAVVNMASRLQIARRTAGSNDEAANNFKNFLSKLTSPDTQKDFEKVGINLKERLLETARNGLDPVEAGVNIIMSKMKDSAPGAALEMQKLSAELANIKDPAERAAEMERRRGFIEALGQRSGLGELFQDMQAMSYLLAELQNRNDLKKIMDETRTGMGKGGKAQIDEDFKKRMEGATEQFKAFKIGVMDIGITIGDALLPPLTELLQELKPGIKAFGDWAKEHPGLIKGVIGLVGGLLAGKMAFIGIKYGINLVLSPFNALRTSITALSGKWTLLRAMWQAGRFAPAIAGLRSIGSGILAVGRFLVPFGQGLLMTFGAPLMLVGRGALFLGRLLVGNLVPGLRLAGQAVLWLGRAMLLNPIGLAVTAIGVAAYLVWKNWDKVKGAVMAGWNWLKGVKNQFFAAGADLINGLVNGVTSKLTAARDSIVSFGSSIKGWFADTLGIKSPSRVFMGFGDNIAQGAAIGIGRSAGLASKAAAGMASDTAAAAAAQRINAGRAGAGAAGAAASGAGGMTIHFSPTIQVQGGAAEAVKGQVTEALNLSLHELEQLIKRVSAQQARRAY